MSLKAFFPDYRLQPQLWWFLLLAALFPLMESYTAKRKLSNYGLGKLGERVWYKWSLLILNNNVAMYSRKK